MVNKLMKSQENPSIKAENTASYVNRRKADESEPITQIQEDNVLTSKDLPRPRVRYGIPLALFAILLFVAALYYGIINP